MPNLFGRGEKVATAVDFQPWYNDVFKMIRKFTISFEKPIWLNPNFR